VIGSAATPNDIIVVIEPRNPADRVAQQFTQLVDAAFETTAAAVMVVPSRIARTAGAIIAVAVDRDDPSIRSALAIAAAEEGMIVLGPAPTKVAPFVSKLRCRRCSQRGCATRPRTIRCGIIARGFSHSSRSAC
jgi:hypothetical protein